MALHDVSDDLIRKGIDAVAANLDKGIAKGKVTAEQREATLGRIAAAPDLAAAVARADLVVEAAPESLELKQQIFGVLDEAAPAEAVLASNTSSLPIGSSSWAWRTMR